MLYMYMYLVKCYCMVMQWVHFSHQHSIIIVISELAADHFMAIH